MITVNRAFVELVKNKIHNLKHFICTKVTPIYTRRRFTENLLVTGVRRGLKLVHGSNWSRSSQELAGLGRS